MKIREYIADHRLLTDGAMGTYFDKLEQDAFLCSEEANIIAPELVKDIHREYCKNGAKLIRSNTFMANRHMYETLCSKEKAFEQITFSEFVLSGYHLANEVVKEEKKKGNTVFVAADIGPLAENGEMEPEELCERYYEICDIFLEDGCDIFVLETFPDETYVLKMADYIHSKNKEAWVLGQFAFMPTGYGSTGFHYSTVLTRSIESGKLDAVGLNCGVGSSHMDIFLKQYMEEHGVPEQVILSALPNCGYPQIVRGRAVYSDSVSYFSKKVREIAKRGVRILGGCCGTTPEYIGAIAKWIDQEEITLPVKVIPELQKQTKNVQKEARNPFREKLERGEKVFAVELDPPFDTDCLKLMNAAKELIGTKADIITLADSPLARSRADSLLMAAKVKRETGMMVMPHLTSRDRNRISIRGGILGAYINDIRNYLLVTGDPVSRSDRENTTAVFDFNSIKCMRYLKQMNETLFAEDPVFYGGALNQDGANIDAIAGRMKKKMEEGCSYFLTQPVYSEKSIEQLRLLKEKTGANILVGILPLVSYRNARFMQNEMPGIYVPDEVVSMYKEDGTREEWEKIAITFSLDIMRKCEGIGAGYYMMTPFNRVSLIKSILDQYE